ncbi:hypothetical protein [Halorubrum trueperi]|uniref:Uncharacterized protein n=1 Tax=Halorubrum trueperi TaxID=2004704 RepID=A0ABD5UR06_9EURY
MGGFKEGTVNGWDEEESDDPDDSEVDRDETDAETDATESASEFSEDEADFSASDADLSASDADVASVQRDHGESTPSDIPWILRRNSITDGREQTVQLHLQQGTLETQRTQKIAIENRLGESVRKADLREAALLVGLQRVDDVADVLEEWGYALE